MEFPKRHDLACFDEEFEWSRIGFCSQQWEISVRQKIGIIWSVVLSYLKSADFKIPGQFEERLNLLTNGKVDAKLAKKAILDFNPFFNIHKCFFNETLKKICADFRNILNKKRGDRKRKVSLDLPDISSLLKINILKVNLAHKELNVITPGSDSSGNMAYITLFYKKHITEENNEQKTRGRFHFGLDEKLCCKLRKEALEIILETSEIKTIAKEEILPLLERGEKNINLLITLLKKDSVGPVPYLYDSSYIAGKLSNAGFETDPRALDQSSGFSAFYYALQANDSNLVYILYRYAANSCYEYENTFRDPNPSIISNFSKLEEILNGDYARSNNFEKCGDKTEQARLNYQGLQRFNEFLTEICDSIHGIRKRPESNSREQAEKQKDIILLILDTYISERFFSIGELDLENYKKHKTYYDNLDMNVALLFFDNIFLLKSVLKSPRPRLYSELESSFLLSTVANKYFTKRIIDDKIQDVGFESDSINLPIIPFLERLNLRENIRSFCCILREKKLGKDDIVDRIPAKEITEVLSNFPELKNVSLIFRLDHYLRPALETEPVGLKQKLVIQRALQVIGESLSVETESSSSIKYLLCKCLPNDTSKVLKKVRNTLSHLESYQFPLKFKIEQDDDLFRSIRSEIRKIKEALQEVFDIQKIRLMEFLINRGLELLQNIQQTESRAAFCEDHFKGSLENFREALRKRSAKFQCILGKKEKDEHRIIVPSIHEFLRRLMGFASNSEEGKIRGEIPPEVKNRADDIQKLEQDLEGRIVINLERFDSLFLKKKDLSSIKKDYEKYLKEEAELSKSSKKSSLLHKIKKAPNPLNILDSIFEKNKVSDSQLKVLYEAIHFSEEAETTLNSLIEISRSPFGDNLANLLNRIKHLHQISIDEQYDIRYLWEKGKSSRVKQFIAYKIVQRYFRDSSFQASLEMLLFDCVAILKNNDDFKSFWLKTSYLFNGIDVRNVLAHGDPLIESIGDMLDPKDLPSELVKKMLQLFEDHECVEDLCELWQKAKLKERIVCCGRWQEYSKLLSEDPKDAETCNGIVAFLEKKPDPKMKKLKK